MTFIYLAFILIITFLAIRLIQVLPLIFIKNNQITEAIKNSWHNTGPRFWKIIVRFILVILIASLVKFAVIGFIVSFQRLLDLMLEKNIAFYFAIGNLSLIKIIQLLLGIWASALSALIVVVDFYQDEKITNSSLYKNTEIHFKKKLGKGSYTISALIILIISIVNFRNYALFINNHDNTKILEISHRGVDGNNGVQNTIPVLKKTAKLKPDYVEMDIHETKDHQFIVMHDANLKQLTGLNKEPYQLTLKQLTKLKVRENGQSAPMASFDDYYQTARKIHQHLLIEIKTTPHDSKNMLDIFLKKYGRIIVNNHDRVHSLDYRIVDGIKQKAPKIFVSYIMPYNLIFPNTKANAYTMEEATLDESFIFGAKNENKQVYAWTVDDPDDMDRMQFIGVNGIITNELSKLKKSIKTNNKRTTYAHRIWLYAKENSIFDFSTIEN
ncbi:hypothetical protein KIMC2_13630 [Xylocopilactobacillus apis]|uniref:GP-PDE domain-containing protein n=2 Tax=Xylocopilactobacillus apis TaxID=2932183 RepID=A0AAU9D2S6_9LACO|nr:hypothetical protein KIMC2_13630 [Xylocopilactobacillus apis]